MQSHVAKVFNESSQHYDCDPFGLLRKSRDQAMTQLKRHVADQSPEVILDMALGTGEMLMKLNELYPQAKLHGIDISDKMIEIAKSKVDVTAYHDDARNVGKYLTPENVDLALIHYVMAFVKPEELLSNAQKVLRPGGCCSILSSTYENFQGLYKLACQFYSEEDIRQIALVPENADALRQCVEAAGLKVVEMETVSEKICFEDAKDVYRWGKHSGWLTQFFSIFTEEEFCAIHQVPDIFPFTDEFKGTAVLARKP